MAVEFKDYYMILGIDRKTDAKTIKYTVTVTDPKAFTRPMTMAWTLNQQHAAGEHYEILETACASGEKALDTLLGDVKR